ncbi:hypothetical protein TTHERM_00077830 (macronuclear) [Tetrahymena thermophila SB210]|uniref:Uncharacterized protein n=1 Tax=Tetrahymena thermophila (strain SB210) TaxID=312017 RepID=Q23FY2_TETTS|nr:hypothetical protein TTHERM_00077830 [Tetrahymena thermophila SB210]EAR95478.1 hypothetical protein TTHERM_00077830 [Tetrahymena thermophila SB210]|eukprot:XP_001015723.1 hypothetical protein TTHERM_00077830 [Tetrahymena thermophila SB210]
MFAQIQTQTQKNTLQQPQGLFSLPNTSISSQQQQPVGQSLFNTSQTNSKNGLNIQTSQQQVSLFQTGQNSSPLFLNNINQNNQQNQNTQNSLTCQPAQTVQQLETQNQKMGLFQTNQNTSLNFLNDLNKNNKQEQVSSNQQKSIFQNTQNIFNQQSTSQNNYKSMFAPQQDFQNTLNTQSPQMLLTANNLPQQLQQENQALKEKILQMDQRICELEKQVKQNDEQNQKIMQLENNFKLLAQFCSQNFKGLCNKGHILEHCTSFLAQNFSCDVCKQNLKDTGLGSYKCQACDFDRCEKCYNENRLI